MTELSMQDAELLPAREALQASATSSILAANIALALPEEDGDALANATQTLVVIQSVED